MMMLTPRAHPHANLHLAVRRQTKMQTVHVNVVHEERLTLYMKLVKQEYTSLLVCKDDLC